MNARASSTRTECQESSSYLPVLAHHCERLAEVDEMLVLREEVGTNRMIVPTSLIGKVIEVANEGPGTAKEGVKKC